VANVGRTKLPPLAQSSILHKSNYGRANYGDKQDTPAYQRSTIWSPAVITLQQLRQHGIIIAQATVWQSLLQDEISTVLGRLSRPLVPATRASRNLKSVLALWSVTKCSGKLVKPATRRSTGLATGRMQQQIREEALGSHVQSLLGRN